MEKELIELVSTGFDFEACQSLLASMLNYTLCVSTISKIPQGMSSRIATYEYTVHRDELMNFNYYFIKIVSHDDLTAVNPPSIPASHTYL